MTHKDEVITFKVDGALGEQLKTMPNRSEFIRQAVLQALEMECPLCHGTGTLTPNQMMHWNEFREHHDLTKCTVCGEPHLVCRDHEHDSREHALPRAHGKEDNRGSESARSVANTNAPADRHSRSGAHAHEPGHDHGSGDPHRPDGNTDPAKR